MPTSDGTEIRLTRYKFGTKGPLVLAPGYGNAARAFAIDTVPKNWVQYLGEHGYDVWLLDYRASPDPAGELHAVHRRRHRDARLARGRRHGARGDRRRTSVQAMGHCVGGLSLFMAMGGGMEGVRSATFSSLAGHPIPTPGNQARAWARMATLLKTLGVKRLDVEYDPKRWDGKLVETVMKARARSGTSTTTRSRAGSTSSTATSTTTRTSTSRRWSRPCRASSAAAT